MMKTTQFSSLHHLMFGGANPDSSGPVTFAVSSLRFLSGLKYRLWLFEKVSPGNWGSDARLRLILLARISGETEGPSSKHGGAGLGNSMVLLARPAADTDR